MNTYYIRDLEHAKAIIAAYERCSSCDACPLHTPEGWLTRFFLHLRRGA